jgi:hypothetical protein
MADKTSDGAQLGVIARLHALWDEAGDGSLLPRQFALELANAEGFNPSTARTQYQRMRSRYAGVQAGAVYGADAAQSPAETSEGVSSPRK